MFGTTTRARRTSTAVGGLLLAGLLSGADLISPGTAAAQATAGKQALLAHFTAGFGGAITSAQRVGGAGPWSPTPEAALLGRVATPRDEERARTAQAGRGTVSGEQALIGRRDRTIS